MLGDRKNTIMKWIIILIIIMKSAWLKTNQFQTVIRREVDNNSQRTLQKNIQSESFRFCCLEMVVWNWRFAAVIILTSKTCYNSNFTALTLSNSEQLPQRLMGIVVFRENVRKPFLAMKTRRNKKSVMANINILMVSQDHYD